MNASAPHAAQPSSFQPPTIPVIMFIFGVVGNVTAIAVLRISRKEQKETTFYTLVCGLAVTDLLGTLLASPVTIATYVRGAWPGARPLCQYSGFVLLFFFMAQLCILCAMSVERYLAINHAYFYNEYVSQRPAALALLAIYVGNAGLCALPGAGWGEVKLQRPGSWCFIDWHGGGNRTSVAAFNLMYAGVNAAVVLATVACNVMVCGALILMRRRFVRRTPPELGAPGRSRDPDGHPARRHFRRGARLLHPLAAEDLREPAVQQPKGRVHGAQQRPAGHPHGLRQPHPGPVGVHPAPEDGGPHAHGEDQVSVLQDGTRPARGRGSVPLRRRPPVVVVVHRVAGLAVFGVAGAAGDGVHLADFSVPGRGRDDVLSRRGGRGLRLTRRGDVTGPEGGQGYSHGAPGVVRGGSAAGELQAGFASVAYGQDGKRPGEMHLSRDRRLRFISSAVNICAGLVGHRDGMK